MISELFSGREYDIGRATVRELDKILGRIDELRPSEKHFAIAKEVSGIIFDAVDSALNGIVITDYEGYIAYCNNSFTKMLDYEDKSEITGMKPGELFTSERIRNLADVKKIIDMKGGDTGEFEIKRKDCTVLFVEILCSDIIDSGGKRTGRIAFFNDITTRKQLQNENETLIRKLREANDAKDKFFSIIAHDLRNPFNALVSGTDMLYNYFDDFEKEQLRELVKGISDSAMITFDLLENLLKWSASQTDRIEMSRENISLKKIAETSVSLLRFNAEKKNVSLDFQSAGNVSAYADADMTSTVIRNLISNAIKFTRSGGKVSVTLSCNESHAQVEVRDTGVGIENTERLFRIDAKHSATGTSGETGTGLGLILCKEFAEKNGGGIRAESEVGKGSRFVFTLPNSEST